VDDAAVLRASHRKYGSQGTSFDERLRSDQQHLRERSADAHLRSHQSDGRQSTLGSE
jgi:hypothetical protein